MAKKYSEEVARVLGKGNLEVGTKILKAKNPKTEIQIVSVKKPDVSESDRNKGIVKNVKSQGTPSTR